MEKEIKWAYFNKNNDYSNRSIEHVREDIFFKIFEKVKDSFFYVRR